MEDVKLVTLAEYWQLPAVSQGYIVYMQADIPGSELRDLKNPYQPGSSKYMCWSRGQQQAALEAQESDD